MYSHGIDWSKIAQVTKNNLATIVLPILSVLLLSIGWIMYENQQQNKMSEWYVLELQKIDHLQNDKKYEYIEQIFNTSPNSLYKVYFGIKLINEFHNNNLEKSINIARQVLSMPHLPTYISDAITIKLSYIYLDHLTNLAKKKIDISEQLKEVISFLETKDIHEGIFYPIRKEALLELKLLANNTEEYIGGLKKLKEEGVYIPNHMSARIDDILKNVDYLNK